LAKNLIEKRGQLTDDDVTAFLEAGFEKEYLLGVIAVVAASTITNYASKSRIHRWRLFCRNTLGVDSPAEGIARNATGDL
jgi:hypothetical protein